MTEVIESLSWFGELSLWWYGLPLLAWTLLGSLVLAGLRFAKDWHPLFHLSVRQALLFAMPLGLLVAVAVGEVATGGPVAEARVAARTVFVDPGAPTPDAPAPDAASPAPSHEASSAAEETPAPTLPGAYFWIGLVTLAAMALSLKRFGQLLRETWALRCFRNALPPVSETTRAQVIAPLEAQLGLARRAVDYRIAPPDTMPVTFGGMRPVVALPEHLLECENDLRMALSHELVHVRRRDYGFRWAERVVDALFAASPLARHLLKEIGRYRELACDAEVIRQTKAPAAYASMLSRQVLPHRQTTPAALGMARSSSFIKTRIAEMERFARNTLPNEVPYGTSLSASAFVLSLVSAGVFLVACSEQPSAALEESRGEQQEMAFRSVVLMKYFSDPPFVSAVGELRSRKTGQPIKGAQVFYTAGGKTDTATTSDTGRFSLRFIPLDIKRLPLIARYEGKKSTYEITRDKTFGRIVRQKKQEFENEPRKFASSEQLLASDFRLALEEVIVDGRQIPVSEGLKTRMLSTPTAYMYISFPKGRLLFSKTSFAGAKKEVFARDQTVTFANDEINITIKTRIPVLREGGTRRLWGRYYPLPAGVSSKGAGIGVGGGTDLSPDVIKHGYNHDTWKLVNQLKNEKDAEDAP